MGILQLTDAWRTCRYGVAVQSIEDAKREGAELFPSSHMTSDISLVLDEDGTIVDNDDYLMAMPFLTRITILYPGEFWQKPWPADRMSDSWGFVNAVDAALRDHTTGELTPPESDRLRVLASHIREQGLATFITFSTDDILLIAGMLPKDLAAAIGESKEEAIRIQQACPHYAAKRQEAMDRIMLLKDCKSKVAVTPQPYFNGSVTTVDQAPLSDFTDKSMTPKDLDRFKVLARRFRREGLAAVSTFLWPDFLLIACMRPKDLTAPLRLTEDEACVVQVVCSDLADECMALMNRWERLQLVKAKLTKRC